jgi:hypothetical protein
MGADHHAVAAGGPGAVVDAGSPDGDADTRACATPLALRDLFHQGNLELAVRRFAGPQDHPWRGQRWRTVVVDAGDDEVLAQRLVPVKLAGRIKPEPGGQLGKPGLLVGSYDVVAGGPAYGCGKCGREYRFDLMLALEGAQFLYCGPEAVSRPVDSGLLYQKEQAGETWNTAGEFFLGSPAPVTRVWPYLSPVPPAITESLQPVLPAEVREQIGVETGAWAEELYAQLETVRAELAADVDAFEERRQQAFADRKGNLVQLYERTINTLTKRPLIGLLANRNVLPKYGFPTDTVELRTVYSGDPAGRRVELSRDLSAAIYEYAPGGEVVAGGKL